MLQALQMVNSYEDNLVYPALSRALSSLSITDTLRPDMKVVIKPNLIIAKGTNVPATTHPAVLRALVRWLKENGITNITLAESSGGPYNAEYMRHVYHTCGVDGLDVHLNDDFTAQTVFCKEGFANRSFHLLTPIVEADYIIDVCKLKTHAMTGFSGGIKNLFGTIPGLEKPQMHYRWPAIEDFSNMLLELAQTVHPCLTIVDAIDCMEGNGPTGGTSHPLHMLLASLDVYTQDIFAAKLMGIEPNSIVMLRQAVEKGLAHPQEMELVGDPVPENLTPFKKPDAISLNFSGNVPKIFSKPFTFLCSKLLKSYPQLQKDKCIGCGKCAESCPAHIIRIKNQKAHFQRKGCISCFCCQEMCPMKAISVKKAL